jgi:hypothetical protein
MFEKHPELQSSLGIGTGLSWLHHCHRGEFDFANLLTSTSSPLLIPFKAHHQFSQKSSEWM